MTERLEPQTASGFRDMLPADAATRQRMCQVIADAFARSGFVPIDTPALERLDVLTGGEGVSGKQIFRTRLADDVEDLGLRFDLTVPLARYVAAHAEQLPMPFRRYQIGKVWRGEHAQAGRFREFIQCDADIIGARGVQADAEIIAAMYAAFTALGVTGFVFRVGHRKILNGLAEFAQYDADQAAPVLRAVDKLDKVGWDGVAGELQDGPGLDQKALDSIRTFLDVARGETADVIKRVGNLLQFSETAHEGIHELEELIAALDALEVPRENWELDLTIARGLGYYTGVVFETTLKALPELGSVCSGGRYDSLVSRFAPMELSGTGASIGLDRLVVALDQLQLLPRVSVGASVAVLNFEPKSLKACLNLSARIRNRGITAYTYLGAESSLKGQLAWAVKNECAVAVLIGPNELEQGVCQIKDLNARTQAESSLVDAPEMIERLLSQ